MKKYMILVAVLITAGFAQAQADFDSDAIDKLSNDTCECIKKIGTIKSEAQAEVELGKCMISSFGKDGKYYKKKGLDFMNDNTAEQLGEAIGMNLAVNCPAFLDIFMKFEMESQREEEMQMEDYQSITGTLVSLTQDTFGVLTVKDLDGRQYKILWLTYVDNGEFIEQALQNNKTYTFVVQELDIYDMRIQDYRNQFILDRIEE